ncbi:MAG: hypothetical protein KIT79_14455 [Deltaproteobacteria bacterium]|nr:hypothetical protein [Deltaproteobacteria bacterium]
MIRYSRFRAAAPLLGGVIIISCLMATPAGAADRSFDFGAEFQLGRAAGKAFDHAQGSIGLLMRVNNQVTFRIKWNHFGPGDQDPPYRTGFSFTGGAVIHPLGFYSNNIKSLYFAPYVAVDAGIGAVYGGTDNRFFHLNFLGGGNFDIGNNWTIFLEGGYLRIDYDNDGRNFGRAGAVDQAVFGAGVRFYF